MAQTTRQSYYAEEYSPTYDPHQVNSRALSWLLQNSKGRGFVAVNLPRSLDDVFRGILSDDQIKQLKSKGKTTVSDVEVIRITTNKAVLDAGHSPVVVFHPTTKLLKKTDSIKNVTSMLVVPITLKEIREWVEKWHATALK